MIKFRIIFGLLLATALFFPLGKTGTKCCFAAGETVSPSCNSDAVSIDGILYASEDNDDFSQFSKLYHKITQRKCVFSHINHFAFLSREAPSYFCYFPARQAHELSFVGVFRI